MRGLRERKKKQTRDAVVEAAFDLFGERGFEATTIADIADAADIAPRTFFAYFETKEAVVFHDAEEVGEAFAARLRDRAAGESTFDALRAWVVEWIELCDALSPHMRERRELIRATPMLQMREQAQHVAFERLLAESVAADLGLPPDSVRPRMVSAAAIAALTALDELGEDGADSERAMAFVDEALAFVGGGLDALTRRPPIA